MLFFLLQPQLGEIAIEASQIISRLEQVAEGNVTDASFNQPTVFLGLVQKRPEDIIQVRGENITCQGCYYCFIAVTNLNIS